MCGIAGVVDLTGRRIVPEHVIRSMARALVHRGPDEEGFLLRPGIALASRRLSIVDLRSGQQPLSNENGTVWVTFNGEIYNHADVRRHSARLAVEPRSRVHRPISGGEEREGGRPQQSGDRHAREVRRWP